MKLFSNANEVCHILVLKNIFETNFHTGNFQYDHKTLDFKDNFTKNVMFYWSVSQVADVKKARFQVRIVHVPMSLASKNADSSK